MYKTWAWTAGILVWSSGMALAQDRPKPQSLPLPAKEVLPSASPAAVTATPDSEMVKSASVEDNHSSACCAVSCCKGAKHTADHDCRFLDWLLYRPIKGGCCGGCPASCRVPLYTFFLDNCATPTWGPPAVASGAACGAHGCGHPLLKHGRASTCCPSIGTPCDGSSSGSITVPATEDIIPKK
jgi:hypothetical protein